MTQNKYITVYFFNLLLLLFMACKPMSIRYADVTTLPSSVEDNKADILTDSIDDNPTLSRSYQGEFKEYFSSRKLDLVFILDTSSEMELFYETNSFGLDFLNQFENYDWKFAYTDMSIDIKSLNNKQSDEQTEDSEKSSCNFFTGLTMAAGGLLLGQGSPFIAGLGLRELGECSWFGSSKSEPIDYANGYFLPLEYKGKALETKSFHEITKKTPDYNTVFDHSLLSNNEPQKKSYSAPIFRKTKSYPFLSLFFSLSRTLNPVQFPEHEEKLSFFREDSLIVYVLITSQDLNLKVSAEEFTESLSSTFSPTNRFKFITITLTEDSSMFCSLKLQQQLTKPEKLLKLAKDLNYPSLDICSLQLGEELFNEISKNLYLKSPLDN
ncbi:MAG: hypothetical protein OXC37_05180 [Bdellovibrionaceae bacterium]|nr:hypothetical protein [Pseudobdellovibrionaceae bacterium]